MTSLERTPPTQEEQEPPVSTMEEDPHVQEEQEPQEEHTIEPNPNDTTMEVDSTTTFGDLVGEIIESIVVNGDKSPREPCVIEVDLAEETNPTNGDKSPGNLEIEVIENSSEAEPDEIEIMDSFGINFSRNNSTPPPPKTPEYYKNPTPFNEPEVEFLGNISNESNISIPRTPGTPKSNRIEESLKSNTKKVLALQKGI